jgi:hypothetical protein
MAEETGAASNFCSASRSVTARLLNSDVVQVIRINKTGPSHVLVALQSQLASYRRRASEFDADLAVRELTLWSASFPLARA